MKKLIIIACTFCLFIIFAPAVYAQVQTQEDFQEITDSLNSSLRDSLDDSTAEIWDEQGLSISDSQTVTGIEAKNVFERLFEMFRQTLKAPFVMLGKILAVSVIYAALKSMYLENTAIEKTFGTICILCIIIVMSDTVAGSFESLQSSIEGINNFMISYIPVFSAVTSAGGNAVTAGAYSAATLFVCEVTAAVASKLLLPFLSAVMAVTVVAAVNPQLKFAGVADSVKKLTTWLLATVMIIFVGLMALQGVTGSAADTLTYRTLRFAAASFIPIIGNSVSEAFLAVKGSMSIIRSTTGSIGIIIIFIMAIKPFLSLLAIKFCIWLGRITNDLLGLNETSEFLKSTNSVLSIGLSILIAFSAAFIISTAAVMFTAVGGT